MQIVSYNYPELQQGTDFHQFFNDELRKTLWCELMLKEMTPFLIKQAMSEDLSKALSMFFLHVENEIDQLEEVFSLLELRMEEKECEITKGVFDTVCLTSCTIRGKVRDAAILSIIQKVLSFQVVTYKTLSMYLRRMKKTGAAVLIDDILSEKKKFESNFYNQSIYINYAAMFAADYKEELLAEEDY